MIFGLSLYARLRKGPELFWGNSRNSTSHERLEPSRFIEPLDSIVIRQVTQTAFFTATSSIDQIADEEAVGNSFFSFVKK